MKKYTAIVIALIVMLSSTALAQTDTIQTTVPQLRLVFANDFTIGCLLSYRNIGFPSDPPVPGQSAVITPNGGYLIQRHMNSMSPGNNMKPQYTVDITASAAAYIAAGTPQDKDSIDTHPIVRFNGDLIAQLNWARRQGFVFRGHTLVWHSQTPAQFFYSGYTTAGTRLTKAKMTARMDFYIREIMRLIHEGWPGMLTAMDVVNEAVNDNGTFRTASNDWYTTFGDTTYVMKAFELARQYTTQYGETQMKLYYNDYNTSTAAKADGIVRLCAPIFQAGFLDGLGMQEHDNLSTPTAAAFVATYNKFFPVCTEMAVTEFDVATGSASPSPAVLTTQANQYGLLFKCFVERSHGSGRGKIISVSKDGLNDQYTFQSGQASSLWDALNQCKPAFFEVVNVGVNYNGLDSLVTAAGLLQQNDYTPGSWTTFAAALASANTVKTQNYTTAQSPATALGAAQSSLKTAIDALVKNPDAVAGDGEALPRSFGLSQNYPNPFNPNSDIRYQIPASGSVRLSVFDLLGREIAVLVDEVKSPGTYTVRFDGSGFASGVYYYRLTAGGSVETRKMILAK